MKLDNKGFGSKEYFMAIIIVCMIIAVIVPSILKYIRNAMNSTITNSVIIFRKQINREIIDYENAGNYVADGCYHVMKNGSICLEEYNDDKCSGEVLKIEGKGLRPNGGLVEIKTSKVSDIYNININNKYVNGQEDEYSITLKPVKKCKCVSGVIEYTNNKDDAS